MRGVFKLAKAEFIKIFKKPTVYIMAFVLVIASLISLFTFSPAQRQDLRVTLSTENAITNYNIFISTSGSDNKANYDATIAETDSLINYFNNINKRNDEFRTIANKLIKLLNNKNASKAELLTEINKLISCYSNTYNLDDVKYFMHFYNLTDENGELYYTKDVEILNKLYDELNVLETSEQINTYITTNKVTDKINEIYSNYTNFVPVILKKIVNDLNVTHNDFITAIQQNSTNQSTQLTNRQKNKLKSIKSLLDKYKNALDVILLTNHPIATIINDNYSAFLKEYTKINKIVDLPDKEIDKFSVRQEVANSLVKETYVNALIKTNNNLNYINLYDSEFINNLNYTKSLKDKNIDDIWKNITEYKNEISTTNISEEITKYKLLSLTYSQNINDKVTQLITSNYSLSEIKNLYELKLTEYNEYELKERISYNDYYIKNNIYSTEFLNVFNFNSNSGFDTNAFDFMYYGIKICTLLIIIFTMFMVASIISSEQDNGTIKLLLVRPYSRSKILSAKLLATFFFSLCFMLFSTIITLVAGVVTYGWPALSSVLVTFNAQYTFALNPILLMAIFIISCLFDVIFYLILAAMLSMVFKSYAGTVTTSILIVIIAMVLSALLPNTAVYTYLPFTSISLFRFFGNSFLPTGSNVLNMFFLTPISPGMSILTSVLVSGIFAISMYVIAFSIFKKRDY